MKNLIVLINIVVLLALSAAYAAPEECRQCTTEFDNCKAKKGSDEAECLRSNTECTKANDKAGCGVAGATNSCPKSNAKDCRQCTTEFDQCMKKKNANEADCLRKDACCVEDNDKMGCA